MSNSWIDRDELADLVGACSKKKARRPSRKSVRKETLLETGAEEAAPESEDIEVESPFEVEEPLPEESELAVDSDSDSDSKAEGLLISSPLAASEEEPPSLEAKASVFELEVESGEENPSLSEESIGNIVVEEREEREGSDEEGLFLGEALSVGELPASDTSSSEALRAIQALAEAREQAESGDLLKIDISDPGEASVSSSDSSQATVGVREAGAPESQSEGENNFPKALSHRFETLAQRIAEELHARHFIFFDDLGNELYRSKDLDHSENALTLFRAAPWEFLEENFSEGVAQVTAGGDSSWIGIVKGQSPAEHLVMHFELDEPIENEQLSHLPFLLSEALYQTSAS